MRVVVGIHSCHEVLKIRPKAIKKIKVRQGWQSAADLKELVELAERHHIRVEPHAPAALDKIARTHQGIAMEVADEPQLNWENFETKGHHLLAALDGIEDPQNLGAIIRTSWLMGVEGILVPKSRSAPMTPAVAKVASGGCEHVPVEEHSSLSTPLRDLKEKGFWIYGLSEKASKSLWSFNYPEKVIWVLGAEGQGIRSATLKECDELVTIPQVTKGPSYNASVAFALALSETRRQWNQPVQKS